MYLKGQLYPWISFIEKRRGLTFTLVITTVLHDKIKKKGKTDGIWLLKFNFGRPTKAKGDENMRRDERLGTLYFHFKIFAHDQIHKITILMVDLRP